MQPTPFTTTMYSGSTFYTSSTILPDGQEEVEVVEPETTTTTSYVATTTIYTTTNTGASGQVTVLVVQPTPGMQYFGFEDPADAGSAQQPNASRFNNDAANINVQGVFPDNINFQTQEVTGLYQFPGQSAPTDASNYAVVFEGYFYGPEGTYSVTVSTATDDYGFLWTNSSAYSDWTNNNAEVTESIGGDYTQNHTFTIAPGDFLPMTILWVNVYQTGDLEFVIYPPGGGNITDTSGYFVQPFAGDNFVYHV